MMRAAAVITALLWLLGSARVAQATDSPLSPERQRAVLRDALNAFDQAGDVTRTDPATSAELYRQSVAGLQALRDAGLRNANLEYNLGNAHFRLGELGRAILHYRRAQGIGPPDARLQANLHYARGRVEPLIVPSGERRLAERLLFWHYGTTLQQRFRTLLLLAAAGWLTLFAWLRWRSRPLAVVGLCLIGTALLVGGSLFSQIRTESQQPAAVLVNGPQPLRLGRSESADLALKQPLGVGTELRVLQRRADWVEVRLPNGQTGWLPASTIESV